MTHSITTQSFRVFHYKKQKTKKIYDYKVIDPESVIKNIGTAKKREKNPRNQKGAWVGVNVCHVQQRGGVKSENFKIWRKGRF